MRNNILLFRIFVFTLRNKYKIFRKMKEFDIIKASKLLPKGSVSDISFDTRIPQSTVSKILNGKETKDYLVVRKQVIKILLKVKEDISSVLENIDDGD